jgi:DtxR family transcriptional regulator, Mn-dependent transcriptional regulator
MAGFENLSEATQNYLKAIYEISPEGGSTSTNQIAERLNVAPASVTGMLKRLANTEPPMIVYHKHHGAELTEEGRKASLQLVRKHRLLELFLLQVLGYTWDEVHEEAERLEHAISTHFVERLAHLLGEPDFDPHGDPIPSRELLIPTMKTIPLDEALAGQHVVVRRVLTSNPALLRYLSDLGIRPGAEMKILDTIPFDRTVHVQVEQEQNKQVFGPEISMLLLVETL